MRSRLAACFSDVGLTVRLVRGILLIVPVAFLPAPAYGHKINVFATAEGKIIHGKAYFHGGAPAQNVAVTAFSPTGQQIGQTETNEEGRFTLEARICCDYRLVVETGDGHSGEYTLTASLLPKDLPAPRAAGGRGEEGGSAREPLPLQHPGNPAASVVPLSADQFEALRAEIIRLEEQLNAYEDRVRVTDILGGIGYIVGVTGAAYYYLGGRRKRLGN